MALDLDDHIIAEMSDFRSLLPTDGSYSLAGLGILLYYIAETCPQLDRQFADLGRATNRVRSDRDLEHLLFAAWQSKDFQMIRDLESLQPKRDSSLSRPTWTSSHRQAAADAQAWNTKFIGDYHILLKLSVDSIAKRLTKDKKSSYQNVFAIVQSSGTGKSRTVHEMAGLVFTLPFNLRPKTETTGFPIADSSVRDFLVRPSEKYALLREIYLLFFACLFESTANLLAPIPAKKDQRELAVTWRALLGSADDQNTSRLALYEGVITETKNRFNLWKSSKPLNEKQNSTPGGGTISHPQHQAVSAAERLISMIHDRTKKIENEGAVLVMYFDESQEMATSKLPLTPGQDPDYTAYHAFCSALSELVREKIVTTFLSTYASLTKYAPTRKLHSSAPGHQVRFDLIPPVVELPFDVWKEEYLVEEDEHMIEDVCKPEFMIRFGRPLFWTRYDAGDRDVRDEIVQFAMSKLIAEQSKKDISIHGKFAALSTRLLLEFEPRREEAIREETRMVARHMRIAYSVPKHLEYLRSGTPSEPILAEAAGHALDGLRMVEVLNTIMDGGLVDKGERGELVARLLLTLAHDEALELSDDVDFPAPQDEAMDVDRPKVTTTFSKPILLTTFLRALFGPIHSKQILSARARGVQDSPIFQDQFLDACVHFTHFAKAADSSVMTTEAAFVALTRGIAWQCVDQQNAIDIIIPILIDRKKTIGRNNVTALFIQIKNSARKQQVHIDEANLNFFDASEKEPKPYVALIMDFGVKQRSGAFAYNPVERPYSRTTSMPKQTRTMGRALPGTDPPPSTFGNLTSGSSSSNTKARPWKGHLCYAISAIGCSSGVYAVIGKHDKNTYAKLLGSRSLLDEHPRRRNDYLNVILRFKFMWMYGLQSYGWARYQGNPRELPVELITTEGVSVDTGSGADSEED